MKSFLFSFLVLMSCAGAVLSPSCSAQANDSARPAANVFYQDWPDKERKRSLPIKIYYPTSGTAPYPVVIFSHGLGGSREAATYLGDYWSRHGYLCIFVQHPGSDTSVWESARGQGMKAIIQEMQKGATGENLILRAGDIRFVLDQLRQKNQTDPALKNKLQLDKIAIAGHSFGAGTALAIAGQNYIVAGGVNQLKDDRVKAAIYLCPPVSESAKENADTAFGGITIPGMLMTGSDDNSPIGRTKAEDRPIPYDHIKAPHQYLINFYGADHMVFGAGKTRPAKPSDEAFQKMIQEITTKFLDGALKGDESSWKWLDGGEADAYLNKNAIYKHK